MDGSVPQPWKTNVMGMFGECRVLVISILCPALAYYSVSEQFENPPANLGKACIGGYCLCCGFLLRSRLRKKYGLDGSLFGDFVAHCCCHCVALARIWREAEAQKRAEAIDIAQHPMSPQGDLAVPQMAMPPQPMPMQQFYVQQAPQQQYIAPGIQSYAYLDPNYQQPVYLPQQPYMMSPQNALQPIDHRNTIDTNLSSDFESRNGSLLNRTETQSYKRNDSFDPPPSNTDPDPWGMLQARRPAADQPPEHQGQRHHERPHRRRAEHQIERAEHPGMPYYDSITPTETIQEGIPSPSPFAARTETDDPRRRIPLGDNRGSRLGERLAHLRPPNCPKMIAESDGGASKRTTNTSDVADEIILGRSDFVRILTITKDDLETPEQQASTSQDDPPQQPLARTGSLLSKPDDASFLTEGATAGSDSRLTPRTLSAEAPKSRIHQTP